MIGKRRSVDYIITCSIVIKFLDKLESHVGIVDGNKVYFIGCFFRGINILHTGTDHIGVAGCLTCNTRISGHTVSILRDGISRSIRNTADPDTRIV